MSKNILFVCTENSARSQMAEAFAKKYGKGIVNAFSAGSKPVGIVNALAIESMAMKGYDLTTHTSKSIDNFSEMQFHYVITMGCGDACPFISSKHREAWDIPDPSDLKIKDFNVVRDLIELKVKQLIAKIEKGR